MRASVACSKQRMGGHGYRAYARLKQAGHRMTVFSFNLGGIPAGSAP